MSRSPYSGSIPDDRLYCPRHHMWVQQTGPDEVLIGATGYGIFLAGDIIAFTSKPRGAEVAIDRGMGTVESSKTVQAVHAPVSFVLLEGNDEAEERPRLVSTDPYGAGWMARARPTRWAEEKPQLVDAAAYRRHVLAAAPKALPE
jgi:glycine cleavage system H protein